MSLPLSLDGDKGVGSGFLFLSWGCCLSPGLVDPWEDTCSLVFNECPELSLLCLLVLRQNIFIVFI